MSIRWSVASEGDFGAYQVHVSTVAGFEPSELTLIASISDRYATWYRIGGLMAGTMYYIKVRVMDVGGKYADSNEVSATTSISGGATPSSGATVEMEYDMAGNLLRVRDWIGETVAEYDELNKDVKITDVYGRVIEYDEVGNRSNILYHDGIKTLYEYDSSNRLVRMERDEGMSDVVVVECERDEVGNVTKQVNENGTYSIFSYNSRNWITRIEHHLSDGSLLKWMDYEYDANGNRVKEIRGDGSYRMFEYDERDQLVREVRVNGNGEVEYDVSYTFDAVGSRLTKVDNMSGDVVSYRQ